MYKVKNLVFDHEDIVFADGCTVAFQGVFGLVPDHHILTFQISSSYSILTHTDDQPIETPTVSEPLPTVAEPVTTVTEPIVTVAEPVPTVAEPIVTSSEPIDAAAVSPTDASAAEKGDA
jgi:perosamine synthetase